MKQKLKIAMLGQKKVPSRDGGIEVVVENLATRMVNLGHELVCFNRKDITPPLKEPVKNYNGIHLKTVWTINKRGLAAMTSSIAAAIHVAFGKFDIAHFHAEGPCVMMWLPKLLGKRCIATVHGLDHQRAKWGKIARSYILLGERIAVKFADEIIVLSKGLEDYFKEQYGRETKFIPNGINAVKKRPANIITEKYGLSQDSYILFLARLVPEKGLKYLINAFKNVKTDKKLVIAGGESDSLDFAKEIYELAKPDSRIIFTDFVQGELLEELYSNAYFYTLPSDLEGMPISLLEAMSFGNCCLVSDIIESASVVENKGITFKKSDTQDLQNKMQMLCDNANLVNPYKENATDFILNKYNWDDVVEKTLNLYQKTTSTTK